MDRPDYGGSLAVPGLPHHGHPLPQLPRSHEAAAAGGDSRHRDPVPGHHRVQPLPRDGGTSNFHYWWRLRWREHRSVRNTNLSSEDFYLQFTTMYCSVWRKGVWDSQPSVLYWGDRASHQRLQPAQGGAAPRLWGACGLSQASHGAKLALSNPLSECSFLFNQTIKCYSVFLQPVLVWNSHSNAFILID